MSKVQCSHCEAENPATSKYCSVCGYQLPVSVIQNVTSEIPSKPIQKPKPKLLRVIAGSIIGCLIGFALAYGVKQAFFKTSIDQELMTFTSEFNKSTPLMIDSDTRLDNTMALPGKILQYNYTLVNTDKSAADADGLKQYLNDRLVNFVKTSPQMKFARDKNVTFNYAYSDRNGEFLFLITITPQDYK